MKAKKFFVRFLNSNETGVFMASQLLSAIADCGNWPLRVVPMDSNGNLVYEFEFLVGDSYSLSFLFNNKDF